MTRFLNLWANTRLLAAVFLLFAAVSSIFASMIYIFFAAVLLLFAVDKMIKTAEFENIKKVGYLDTKTL